MKKNSFCLDFAGFLRYFTGASATPWRQQTKYKASSTTATAAAVSFLVILFVGASVFIGDFQTSLFSGFTSQNSLFTRAKLLKNPDVPLNCTTGDVKLQSCPTNYATTHNPTPDPDRPSNVTCPSYFRWIHEDLRPWIRTGITKDMIERARRTAHFRLVIVNGKAYLEKYKKSLQTRDMFTLWGILQLLRLYPGRLPDLELMFDCDDRPVIRGPREGPPALFRYCGDGSTFDIVFPDWSFWGWAETNIKPWEQVLKDIKEGNKRIKWKDRVPYAYWRGNPNVSPIRSNLMTCNLSSQNDWNTRLYVQDWIKESKQNYKQSNLEDQCTHRYKIYVEGWAWSVSEKYILACDSMTLYITPRYYDFFIRGMLPLQHYWPIRDNSKCTSLKFAVEWGNNDTNKAQAIGEASSRFMQEDLKMKHVYDYMFHLLNEYAKLLKFKPTIPPRAVELCLETMVCPTNGIWRKFMVDSMVKSPSDETLCMLPPPYDPPALREFIDKKFRSTKQVEAWENEYWENVNKKIKNQ